MKRAGTSLWRRSGALRWTVYLLLIFVVPQTCVWVTLDTINRRAVERKLQAIRDAGDPVTMTELAPAPVPDDQNAAVLYQQVFRMDFNARRYRNDSLLEATGHNDLIEWEFGEAGSKATQARAVLDDPAVISIFETLEEASLRPDCVFSARWEDEGTASQPHIAELMQAITWLCAKARLCAMDGDADESLRWIGVTLRMSDHLAREAVCHPSRVGFAYYATGLTELERTLSEATPSAEATQNLLYCLERVDVKERFDQAVRGVRAVDIDTYELFRRAPAPGSDWAEELVRNPALKLVYFYRFTLFRPLYNADLIKYLTHMEEALSRAALVPAPPDPPLGPWRRFLFGRVRDPIQAKGFNQYSHWLFHLDYSRHPLEERDSYIMENDIARVALALTLYKIEHGEYPATLDELQATLDSELPRDFFAGAPLTYQRRPDGFLLYSFGNDRDDDGGASRRASGRSRDDCDLVWVCPVPPPPPPPPPASGGTGMGFR